MELKRIALTSIIILALFVMVTDHVVSNHIVQSGFDELERQQVASDMRRVKNEFLREIENLDTFLWDWASWDDTYDFVQDQNTEYIESNLPAATFQEQNLNIIIFLGPNDRTVYARAMDEDGKDEESLAHQFLALTRGVELPQITPEGGSGGLLMMSGTPLIFARRPVLHSGGEGPPAGSMLMARFVMDEDIEEISNRLELPIVASAAGKSPSSKDNQVPMQKILDDNDNTISVIDETTIDGFTLLRDVNGMPALVLRVSEAREVSRHGRTVALYNTIFTGAIFLTFCFLIYILLQKRVISRVVLLSQQVQQIDLSKETPTQFPTSGDDEISQLTHNVNAMLVRISNDQKALRQAHDDLEHKVAERTLELEEANQELICLDKAKSHFLSSTSHELRTPLTAIIGFIKLMERTFTNRFQPHLNNVDEATKHIGTYLENFKIVRLETERLGRLINDLLDLNKIEANRIDWRDNDVNPLELIHAAARTIEGQFNDTPGVDLLIDTPDVLPVLRVDPDRIHQVLINLLNNAAKFTEQGAVTLAVRESGDNTLEFSVTDTGKGIPAEDLEQLFEIFYQAENDADYYGSQLGTGLGLAICKEIVEHYNGKIWVESKLGEGSSFKFILPISASSSD